MKAAVFHSSGGPDVLRVEDVPTPEPGPGDVRVAVRAAALNHLDIHVRRGLPIDLTLPHIGGSDVAGVIDVAGPDVRGWKPGDRVIIDPSLSCGTCQACLRGEESLCVHYRILGEHVAGGFAEYVVAPAANLYRIPDNVGFEQAAAAPLAFLTAWRGLVTRGRLHAGESVLVTGASGGVAIAAIRVAIHLEASVYAITTTEHVERVRALGALAVFDRTQDDHRQRLWEQTGKRGVDVVFDSVGEATWMDNVRALARGGRMVVYGATSGPHGATDIRHIFWKQIEILGTTMANRREFLKVMDLVFGGALEPVIDCVMPLDQVRTAHERLERGEQFGKIVLTP